MDRQKIKYCYLSGIFEAVDRPLIRSECERFGKTRKIYITTEFAKVYFENLGDCERAVQGLGNNAFGWIVLLREENSHHNAGIQANSTIKSTSNMDDYLDEDFLENNEYCDVHGNPLTTFQGEESNDLYVKLKDIRRAGFAVFRKDSFDRLMVTKNQIFKEFELHLLSAAKNYILKNRAGEIDEEQILKTIERCKNKLLGNQSSLSNSQSVSMGRKVTNSDNNFKICAQNAPRGGYESFNFSEPATPQRPPKTLPSNFVPSQRNNNNRTSQGLTDNARDTNGFSSDRDYLSDQSRSNNSEHRGRSRTRDEATQFSDDSGRHRGNAGYRNKSRTFEEGSQFCDNSHNSRMGSYSRDQNSQFGSNSDVTQRSRPRDSGSQFSKNSVKSHRSHHSRDNIDRSSDTSERKPRMEFEVNEQIEKVILQVGNSYDVQICHLEKERGRDNICWVHKQDMTSDLEDIILKLLDVGPECEVVTNPKTGQLCMALFEDAWYRCKLLKKDPLYVQFIDYGNKSLVDSVSVLPTEFKTIPALAVRMVLDTKNSTVLEEDMDFKVSIKIQYDDGTYLVNSDKQASKSSEQKFQQQTSKPAEQQPQPHTSKHAEQQPQQQTRVEEAPKDFSEETIEEAPSSTEKSAEKAEEKKKPTEKKYFQVPEPLTTLKNGDLIMICGIVGNRFAVKTKESAMKTMEVTNYIKSLDKSALLLSDVKKGQLVLCSIDGMPNLYRAIVEDEPSGGTVIVRYLDYSGENQMTVKSLRNVDDFLATHRSCLLLTPECPLLDNLSDKGVEHVSQLIEKKTKVKLVMKEDSDFDIQMDDGSLLLQNIRGFESKPVKSEKPIDDIKLVPVKHPATEKTLPKVEQVKELPKVDQVDSSPTVEQVKSPVKEVINAIPVLYDDMDWIKAEVGKTEQFICYTIKDLENVTLISFTDESLKHLESVTDLVVNDETPYEPELFEMCMVSYKVPGDTEATWYRGAVLEKEGNEITVNSVDYGTNIVVTKKDIRKFDRKYKDIPILGITCELINIPNNEKVLEKIKELIPEGEQVEVVLKDFDGLRYQIEIPEVYSILKKQGLM